MTKAKLREGLSEPVEYEMYWVPSDGIDWNESYEYWILECMNGLNCGDQANMYIMTPKGIMAVNTLDFDFVENNND